MAELRVVLGLQTDLSFLLQVPTVDRIDGSEGPPLLTHIFKAPGRNGSYSCSRVDWDFNGGCVDIAALT